MNDSITVVAWDDPRCVQPLEAASQQWRERCGQQVRITRRPLTAFNDQPLSELAPQCDLMIIDYPHVAQALAEQAITPIDALLDADALAAISAAAIGPAQQSFQIGAHITALASDAACHISAHRPRVLEKIGADVPASWDDVFALAARAPKAVALALYPTDAISCIMSLTAGAGAGPDGGARLFPDPAAARDAVERLGALAAIVDPRCHDSTPQRLHKWASEEDDIAYVPLTFGYSRLSRAAEGGWRFGAPPKGCGSLLGGAGMAVSSQSSAPADAAAFAQWYCSSDGQLLAGRHWGQPAGSVAWKDSVADEMTAGFFSATRATQEAAYVRPLEVWWPAVQDEAGVALSEMLIAGAKTSDIIERLEKIYAALRPNAA